MDQQSIYWRKILGIEAFKIRYYAQYFLYKALGITLPKLKDQKDYWKERGRVYMSEIMNSGYLTRELFFQDMLINELRNIEFKSIFEAGCGFGWNIKRVHEEFPSVTVGGLDYSSSQLLNSKQYLGHMPICVVNGDNCSMPLKDKAYDIGFSVGVFMNIHPSRIRDALREMVRVCRKYIIHVEYDESNTTPELKERRTFKTNIISHNYRKIYEELGMRVVSFLTYKDFGEAYYSHEREIKSELKRWEGFEGPEKYIFTIIKVH